MVDAIVIGGGIVGASAAYHLVSDGAETLLMIAQTWDVPQTPEQDHYSRHWRPGDIGCGGLKSLWKQIHIYPLLVDQRRLSSQTIRVSRHVACCGSPLMTTKVATVGAIACPACRTPATLRSPPADDLYEVSENEARVLFPPLGAVQRALYFRKPRGSMDGASQKTMIRAADTAWIESAARQRRAVDGRFVARTKRYRCSYRR